MKRVLAGFLAILAMIFATPVLYPANAHAAAIQQSGDECGNQSAFFALKPWYAGLTTLVNGRCEIGTPDEPPLFVWTIVLNILYDITVLAGYIAVIMVAWGGYLYMFSRGLPDRAIKGKNTLLAAAAGLAITMLASVVMNTIVTILTNRS